MAGFLVVRRRWAEGLVVVVIVDFGREKSEVVSGNVIADCLPTATWAPLLVMFHYTCLRVRHAPARGCSR